MSKRCLFLINGLGLGNSTRCFAVMEHLIEAGMEVHVLTSGNGLEFFRGKPIHSLTPVMGYSYSGRNGHVSGVRTHLAILSHLRVTWVKQRQIREALDRIQPDVAVLDSEYVIHPFHRRGVPVAAINNAEVVVTEYLKARDNPASIRNHFWLIEFFDYLFHRTFCDRVLSPSAFPTPPRRPNFRRIGLIVRSALRQAADGARLAPLPQPRDIRTVVFMLSGSIFASKIAFEEQPLPFHVDVVGRDGPSTADVTFHGRVMNNIDLLRKADVLVVNGGYSAVSEAMFLGKPTLVIPVPAHAEQYVNARMVRDLGLGYIADEQNVLGMLRHAWETNSWQGLKAVPEAVDSDGAREAADAIRELADARRVCP